MKRIFLKLFLLFIFSNYGFSLINALTSFRISGNYSSSKLDKSKIKTIILCSDEDKWLGNVAKIINNDLDFTDQIKVDLKLYKQKLTDDVLEKLFKQGIVFCIALSKVDNFKVLPNIKTTNESAQSLLTVSVYNTFSKQVIDSKVLPFKEKDPIDCGHIISDSILKVLTGNSICLNKLAYCKTIAPNVRNICISDYLCQNEKVIVANNAVNIAPNWHPWLPIIFYTQFTKSNNRLMSVNFTRGEHKVVASFEGLNMQPAFSQNGRRVVLCLTINGNSELYLYDHDESLKVGKKTYKQLTNNNATNVSPCLVAKENIVFCSDVDSKLPQLCYLDLHTGKVRKLTTDSYCVSPSYCKKTDAILYSKYVNGVFQIFEMKLDSQGKVLANKQLTFGPGDKQEPSCSPCGHYVAFTYYFVNNNNERTSQIAIMNISTKKIRIVSSGNDQKSYPVWRLV